jgi:hypothetical protein
LALRGIALLFVLAAAGAMALGRVSFTIGAVGLGGAIVAALISSSIQKRRLQKAIEESDEP